MIFLRSLPPTFLALFLLTSTGCGDGGSGTGGSGTGGSGGSTTSTGGSGTGGTGGSATGGSGTGGSTTSTGGSGTGGTGGSTGPMVLTSPVLTEGATFPTDHTCAGENISPELDWTPGPAGTLSYAIVFEDESNGLIHSAIYDIPADTLSLPEAVDNDQFPADVPGAKQTKAYAPSVYGYLGPCPGGNEHTYTFTLYALDTAALPVAGIVSKESVAEVAAEHAFATATLSGKSDASP